MALAAQVLEPTVSQKPYPRRFELPDLSQHGDWLLKRLLAKYKHLTEQQLAGWLRGIVYNNEFFFQYLPHAVALFQVERGHTLNPQPLIREHFVWALDSKNPEHVDEAAEFYASVLKWAKSQNAGIIIVEENSDVPSEIVKSKCGARVFTREQKFVRL